MYTLIRTITFRSLLTQHLPAAGLSILLAEVFYKFHSFTLETGAFLGTWFVLDYLLQAIRRTEHQTQESATN
ncbi:MAG TPA: hypothetical protein PLD20_06965 [Blastocatellia bacterium]|nr:hypothetical protein [Blastocatellia bacterium]HMV85294.1 hypothetical protein [Blastocatellia bacterium]HMX26785.1 hypothetical protein [Blastocatellia bacterium]HMY75941.1 hypothetical protein [Blastocatellia bacterium]HMZ17650.1 hypothetical protein [Blastocatellia bacterium]